MRKRMENAADLREKLAAQGRHLTRQRAVVYDCLAADNHPTAEDVFLSVKRVLPSVSLGTVYKSLEALVECGAASKLTYGDAARYDVRTDHHYHTRCRRCGGMWDLDARKGPALLKQIAPQAGFEVTDYRLELQGYCAECRK